GYFNLAVCFSDSERDIDGNSRSQENIYRPLYFAKAGMVHSQPVSARCQEEELIHAFAIGFTGLSCTFGVVLDLNVRIRHDRTALISDDTGKSAGRCGLRVEFVGESERHTDKKHWKVQPTHRPDPHRTTPRDSIRYTPSPQGVIIPLSTTIRNVKLSPNAFPCDGGLRTPDARK